MKKENIMEGNWISIFDISFKCQILAALAVLILIIDFFRSGRLPLRSTKLFGCFLIVCLFTSVPGTGI